jgi:DNA mismatch endonuclease, patch repair protein
LVDVHDRPTRSRNMAAIRGANTQPELIIRQLLFAAGFRYRLHDRRLPGKPDLMFPKHHAVIFVHGCFFHGHECESFRWPRSRAAFWREKIQGNRARDVAAVQRLRRDGWRVMIVWECAARGRKRLAPAGLAKRLSDWLWSESGTGEISGGD